MSFTVCLVGAFEVVLFEVLLAVLVVWVDLVLFPTDFFVDVEALEVEPLDVDWRVSPPARGSATSSVPTTPTQTLTRTLAQIAVQPLNPASLEGVPSSQL